MTAREPIPTLILDPGATLTVRARNHHQVGTLNFDVEARHPASHATVRDDGVRVVLRLYAGGCCAAILDLHPETARRLAGRLERAAAEAQGEEFGRE